MGSSQTGLRSSVISVDVLGRAQLNFTHGPHATILQPKPETPMKFSELNNSAFCLVHTAQFPRLKVQKGSI